MATTGVPAPFWRSWSKAPPRRLPHAGRSQSDADGAIFVAEGAGWQARGHQAREGAREPVDDGNGGVGVVHRRREGAGPDLHEVANREGGVLHRRAVRTESEGARNRVFERGGDAPARMDGDLPPVGDEVVAGVEAEGDQDIGLPRGFDEGAEVDGLHVALPGDARAAGVAFETGGKKRLRVVFGGVVERAEAGDASFEFRAFEVNDRLGQHRAGEGVGVKDEKEHAEEREADGERERGGRGDGLVGRPSQPGDEEEAEDDGHGVGAEDELRLAAGHVGADEARAELAGGEGERHEGEGEDEARHRDHGGQDHAEELERVGPGRRVVEAGSARVEARGEEGEGRAGRRHEEGQEPEAGAGLVPRRAKRREVPEAGLHARRTAASDRPSARRAALWMAVAAISPCAMATAIWLRPVTTSPAAQRPGTLVS